MTGRYGPARAERGSAEPGSADAGSAEAGNREYRRDRRRNNRVAKYEGDRFHLLDWVHQ